MLEDVGTNRKIAAFLFRIRFFRRKRGSKYEPLDLFLFFKFTFDGGLVFLFLIGHISRNLVLFINKKLALVLFSLAFCEAKPFCSVVESIHFIVSLIGPIFRIQQNIRIVKLFYTKKKRKFNIKTKKILKELPIRI